MAGVVGYDDYDRYGGYNGGSRYGSGYGRSDRDGYSGRNRFSTGFSGYSSGGSRSRGSHVVYMRGLPFSANEHDVLKVNSPHDCFLL